MEIRSLQVGMVGTNCYLLTMEETGKTIIVDPGAEGRKIADVLKDNNLTASAIYLTHGHFDHIMGCMELKDLLDVNIYLGEKEWELAKDPILNASRTMGGRDFVLKADIPVKDGQILSEAGLPCQVVATPGHTAGGVCYWFREEDVLVCGDTLFCRGIGRSDLPTGDGSELLHSIRERLLCLPPETLCLPGHGPVTTIGEEKEMNSYLDEDAEWFD
ncbi:MBL fold metallo-hydrolase [Anaerolentibacter hominis]|uniref:MBL fold metallo-hydrolase n=1 Tax=Anaerolentibacter hominis TaxID=3079009 RepID=UPI0031B82D21